MDDLKVFPSETIPEHTVKLSICDAYSPKVWVTQAHFWEAKDARSFERTYSVLKEGLSRTLTEIPALAGRVGRGSDDPRDLVIRIKSDDYVEFSHEDLSGIDGISKYETLKVEGFPVTDLRMPLSAKITLTPVSEGAPMLVAKLNQLKGGIALAFGFNHLLADASTVAEVERIWSLHATDVSCGRKRQLHRPLTADDATRRVLSTPVPVSEEFHDEHWTVFPTELSQLNLPRQAVSAEAALTMLHKAKEAHLASLNGAIDEPKWCIWNFTPESLAKLKQDASGPDAARWISTMDALIGLFWSRLAFIKQKSSEGYEKSTICFPINIRQRLEPPLNPQYVGNAVDIISAECPLAELEAEDNGLLVAAQTVRKAVTGWTQPKWEAWLTMAASLPADKAICPNPLMLLAAHNMGFNDYSKSQSNTLNWGIEGGVPDRTRYLKPAASMAGCATAVVVHPRLADGGFEVATTSNDHVRSALEKDKMFQRYARLTTAFA